MISPFETTFRLRVVRDIREGNYNLEAKMALLSHPEDWVEIFKLLSPIITRTFPLSPWIHSHFHRALNSSGNRYTYMKSENSRIIALMSAQFIQERKKNITKNYLYSGVTLVSKARIAD